MESPPSSESHDQVTSGDLLKWKLHDDEGEGSGDSSSLTSRRREESVDDGTVEPHEPMPSDPTAKKQHIVSNWIQKAMIISS
jgi:hypothetical protein